MIRVGELGVGLEQEDVLVLILAVRHGERREERRRRLRRRVGWDRAGQEGVVRDRVPLRVDVGEEEVLVAHDRAADAAAVLVEVIRALRHRHAGRVLADDVEVVLGAILLVAIELEDRPIEVVRARLRDHVDHGAAGAAVLGGVAVGVDLELLHGVLAELVRRAAGAGAAEGLAEEGVVVVGAVDDDAVQRAALAGEADVAAARILDHARRGQDEVDEVAAVDGEVLDRLVVDDRGDFRLRRLDERGRRGDGHGLGDARLHPEVERDGRADVDHDAVELHRLEAGELAADAVGPRHQQRDLVVARAIRDGRSRGGGADVRRRHRDAGKRAAGSVADVAVDRAVAALSECRERHEQCE